jgi:benzylsuccinate CoA-transferase BbsE subunit
MPTSYFHAAPEAVLGILTALYAQGGSDVAAEKTMPESRALFVDVSMQECQLATLITGAGQYTLNPQLRGRSGAHLGRTREIWQAKDGYISYGLRGGQTRIPNLIATVEYMRESGAAPQWLLDYDWQQFNPITMEDAEIEQFEDAFGAFFRGKSMRELYDQALERRILLAPCNDAREILEQVQLRDRNFFVALDYPELGAAIEHPRFFALSNRFELGVRGRAPMIGEHNVEVFGELGIAESELASLHEQGVV